MEGNKIHNRLELGKAREPEFGPIRLDLLSKTLQLNGSDRVKKLSDQEYQILWMLVRAQGNIITQSEMEDFLYAERPDSEDLPMGNTVAVQILRIREKLDELTGGKVLINTVLRIGYQLELVTQKP